MKTADECERKALLALAGAVHPTEIAKAQVWATLAVAAATMQVAQEINERHR